MTKSKKETPALESPFAPIIEGAKKHVLDVVKNLIQEKIKQAEKLGTEIALLAFFLLTGIVFVLISLVFFLRDQFGLSFSGSFLVVGVLSLLVSFFIYKMIKNN